MKNAKSNGEWEKAKKDIATWDAKQKAATAAFTTAEAAEQTAKTAKETAEKAETTATSARSAKGDAAKGTTKKQ